jgi:hypothetical protein
MDVDDVPLAPRHPLASPVGDSIMRQVRHPGIAQPTANGGSVPASSALGCAGSCARATCRTSVATDGPVIDSPAGITTVLWTSGYRLDFGWLDLPILDEWGVPRQDRGVSDVPGLYFIGLPWLYTQLSPTLVGVGWDAAHLARRMGLIDA